MAPKVTPNVNKAVNEYLEFAKAKAPDVDQADRRSVLFRFVKHVRNCKVSSLKPLHAETFFYGAKGLHQTCGKSTLRTYRGTLAALFDFCRRRGWLRYNKEEMCSGIADRVPANSRARYRLTRPQIRALVAASVDPRDRALIFFCASTGVRISEALDLQLKDVSFEKGEIYVYASKPRKHLVLPLASDLEAELRRWITRYLTVQPGAPDTARLFPSRNRPRFRGPGVVEQVGYNIAGRISNPGQVLRAVADPAGIELEPGDGWHTLRRSFARILYDDCVSRGHDHAIRIVQAALGHASMKETEKYIGIFPEQQQYMGLVKGRPFLTADEEPGKVTPITGRLVDGPQADEVDEVDEDSACHACGRVA